VIVLMQEDCFSSRVHNLINMLIFDNCFAVENNFVTLNRYHLAGILVNKIFNP